MATDPSPYAGLAAAGDTASRLGSAFISLVEPHPGHEHAYNRWYEDDHFYSTGAMAMPWWMAGRRWVATKALRDLRAPGDSSFAAPADAGCYLGTYWITAGHWADQWAWLSTAARRLAAEDRMFTERTHVHTAFFDHLFTVTRDARGSREIHALDHPYAGLVLEVVDGPRDELRRWLADEHLPARVAAEGVGQCVAFAPRPWPEGDLWFDGPAVVEDRVVLLWFLDRGPDDCWPAAFAEEPALVELGGAGKVDLLAPFVPTVPGTDRYVDELR